MKNIIITGATSYIGIHLIKELIKDDTIKIYGIVRPGTNKIELLPRSDRIITIHLDMSNYTNLDQHITDFCDCLIHLAWNGTRGSDRMNAEMQEQNYYYSMEVLKSSFRLGISTVISAGSGAEYGLHNHPITENTLCIPNTEYGKQKLKFYYDAFRFCNENNVHLKEPRFFSLYGPKDFDDTMIMSTLKNMLNNNDCLLTECVQLWDFLYIDDAITGLIELINNKTTDGVFNFGSGLAKPLKLYIEEMYKITNSNSRLLFGAIPYPPTGMVSLQPIVDKLKVETGWQPKVSFQEGIIHTIAGIN